MQLINAHRQNAYLYGELASGESHYNYFRDYNPKTGRYIESDPIGLVGGTNTFSYVRSNPLILVDPSGLIDIKIPGATGDNSIHANPGPEATNFRPDHNPAHVHLGKNDGPRVKVDTFEPYSDADAKRMSRSQKKFCKDLSEESKELVRKRQGQVFKFGKVLEGILAGPPLLSITATCKQDPGYCLDLIESGVLP